MKFLCVECDAAMKLTETRGPEADSMTVVFGCPQCGKSIAMLTNAMETQMVRSLGVKVGGEVNAAAPMATARTLLVQSDDQSDDQAEANPESPSVDASIVAAETSSTSKCPFTGMVTEAFDEGTPRITWTADAEARLERIPSFVRPMVRKSIEQHALEKGYSEINDVVMEEMKDIVGMRYS